MNLTKFATELDENKEEKVIEISEVTAEDLMPKLNEYKKVLEEDKEE